ncbi:MAG: TonB-dependent receptor [Aquisalimonadaceae bacterium]
MDFDPRHIRLLAVSLGVGLTGTAIAETIALDPITVTVPRVARDSMRVPQAVTAVQPEDIRQGRQGLQLDESLNRVPGLFMQNRYNFAQNLRLSMRGFGARAPFGIRGIRLRVDGIPETLPDGQSQVDTIDLESVDRIEVIRGPSSALYGNASGGVVDITTMGGPEAPYAELHGTVGSDGFRRLGALGGGRTGPWSYHASGWGMRYDGFRNQSEVEKRLFNGKLRYDVDEHRSVTTVFTALDAPLGEDPGGLTADEVRQNRRAAAPAAASLDAGQQVEHQRLGVIFRDTDVAGGTLTVRTFYTHRDFRQQLPFPGPSLIDFDRDFFGAGADYVGEGALGAFPVQYVVGTEVERQRDDRRRYTVNPAGEVTGQPQDEVQKADSVGLFSLADIGLTERLDLTLAGRVDRVRFAIDDRRTVDGDDSGRRSFDEYSYSVGLGYQIDPDHRVYANVSSSFETPTFTEFAPAGNDGGFNQDLEPQRALNLEVGSKGFLGQRTRYELALFSVRTRDEIVNIQTTPNVYANVGRTRRHGLELGLEHFLTTRLSLAGAYTWSDFRFRQFQADGGNRLPGLPRHTLFAELAWRDPGGPYAILDALLVGSVYADNANQVRVPGYGVVNARTGTTRRLAGGTEVEGFIGVNNLLDKDYFSNIRINADPGDPPNQRRYYEPAPGRNLYAGIRARF